MRPTYLLLFILSLVFQAPFALADGVLEDVPGFIPLESGGRAAASDLIYQGKLLQPDEASQLEKQGVDISTLEPSTDNDIYKGVSSFDPQEKSTEELAKIGIDVSKPVQYFDYVPARSGDFRFSASQSQGFFRAQQNFTFFVSKQSHAILLRKAMLEKLGYRVPPIGLVHEIRVAFSNPGARDSFLQRMAESTYGAPLERWAKLPQDSSYDIILSDVLVMSAQTDFYNLALGYLPVGVIRDFRMFRSMAVLYELLNWEESVNSFSWGFSRIVSNHLLLDFKDADNFLGNYEDSRWLANKIANLTRDDFAAAVAKSEAPQAVQLLLVEKLLSRRNEMLKVFALKQPKMKVEADISLLPDLEKGKLKTQSWPGFGSRFSFTDPESPFANGELFRFFRSKVYSNALSNGISYINQHVIPNTTNSVSQKASDENVKALQNQILNFIKTKKWQKIPLQTWAAPTAGVNIISSRDIVIGSYMGSDNKVQLADAVGVNLNLGAYVGVIGLPTPWSGAVIPNASLTRTYTHLRPIQNIKAALSYPVKNVIVPLLEHDEAKLIDEIVSDIPGANDSSEAQQKLEKAVNVFKDSLGIGESVVITDSIGPSISAQLSAGLANLTSISASLSSQQLFLTRVHVYRADENTIHVYKDIGQSLKFQISITLTALAPVINISASHTNGKATTKFYSLSIDPSLEKNPDLKGNLASLRQVLSNNDFELLDAEQKPYQFKTDFQQSRKDFTLLFFRAAAMDSIQTIDVIKPADKDHPEASRQFLRRSIVDMTGNDFQYLLTNNLNAIVAELTKNSDIVLTSAQSGRPSDTIYGDSVIRNISIDARVDDQQNVVEPFITIGTTWAGWRASQAKTRKIINEISKHFGKDLYPELLLQNTNHIDLYSIEMFYNVYGDGVNFFLHLSEADRAAIFEKYKARRLTETRTVTDPETGESVQEDVYVPSVIAQALTKLSASKGSSQYSENLLRIVAMAEPYLNREGVFAVFGGEQNVLAGSRLSGFRAGEEQGDKPYLSNTLGEFGNPAISGPLEQVRSFTNSSSTEFYLYWLMERL